MEDVERPAARLVLARVVPGEPALRPGDRHGRARAGRATRQHVRRAVRQPRARRAADSRALHLQRRLDAGLRLSGRSVEHEHDALRPRAYAFDGKKLAKIELDPGQAARGHRPDEQRLADGWRKRHVTQHFGASRSVPRLASPRRIPHRFFARIVPRHSPRRSCTGYRLFAAGEWRSSSTYA